MRQGNRFPRALEWAVGFLAMAAIPENLASGQEWRQVQGGTSPAARCYVAMAYDPILNQTILFGGLAGSTRLQDTWCFDHTLQAWFELSPATVPPRRSEHAMVYAPAFGGIIMFGGIDGSDLKNDLWKWDGGNWVPIPTAGDKPLPRSLCGMVYDYSRGTVLMGFGLTDVPGNQYANDLWELVPSLGGAEWVDVPGQPDEPDPARPSRRAWPGLAFDSGTNRILLFGGEDVSTSRLNDTWEWSWTTNAWIRLYPLASPAGRAGHAMPSGGPAVMVFAGNGSGAGNFFQDLWRWDGSLPTPDWTPLYPSGPAPSPRTLHAASFCSADGRLLIFGGLGTGSQCLGDTWEYGVFNAPPIADAGRPQCVHPGSVVVLDPSASTDPDGHYPLTYRWSLLGKPAGSLAALSDPDALNPSFTPDLLGDYLVGLVVTDALGAASGPSTVVISTFNTAPVADGGPDQALYVLGTKVQLKSQAYDDEGDPIVLLWEIIWRPAGSSAVLDDPASLEPSFVADIYGEYRIRLTATDCFDAVSDPEDENAVVVVSFTNVPPVAEAGSGQAVYTGTIVELRGNGNDANQDPLSYRWYFVSLPEGSAAAFGDPFAKDTQFLADLPGTYVVSLVVNDGEFASNPSNIIIQATSLQGEIIQALQNLIAGIRALPAQDFKNPNMRNALINKVNAVVSMVEHGNYPGALDKLANDIRGKTDGCAANQAPDHNDWIVSCSGQAAIYPLVMECIRLVLLKV